ncbi:hypothetical protein CQW23_24850 [Capsicum baccatum]|uniref:Uncharacterized protein n=1 Tax=Capsicum baccatum TaxID=33114 RepID=A0A2G2VVY8_CAPBA|nr:hypothetical protein CQW23_24850 [Capsicum baccatum]
MTIEDLIVRLRIEEHNKSAERRSNGNSTMSGAHIVEDSQNNSKKRKKVEYGGNQPKIISRENASIVAKLDTSPQMSSPEERQEKGPSEYD